MKRVLATGSNGMVGSRFVELYNDELELLLPSEKDLDITDKDAVKKYVHDHHFDVIINFAAYTNVNEAEKQRGNKKGLCWKVNVDGVKNLIDSIEQSNIRFIQISTDMVFSGSNETPGPYMENSRPEDDLSNLTWYGYTKAEADRFIQSKLKYMSSIVRINYPVRSSFDSKKDFLRGPLSLFDQGSLYPLITDQQITISFIDEIAEVLAKIISESKSGTYHVSSTNSGTPFEIISYLLEVARGVDSNTLQTTNLENFLQKTNQPYYRYPKHGGLDVQQTQEMLNIQFRSWKQIVGELIDQGLGN